MFRRLNGEEYAKLKRELKERKQRLRALPRFRLKGFGETASLTVEPATDRIPIFLRDVQHLLMYSLLGHFSPYLPARWCQLEKFNKVRSLMSGDNLFFSRGGRFVFAEISDLQDLFSFLLDRSRIR